MQSLSSLLETPPCSLPAASFVDALQEYAQASHAANHPLLLALAAGAVSDLRSAVRAVLCEYYVYSRSFTRHLSAVSSTLHDPGHRAALVPNAAEESGAVGEDHLELLAASGLRLEDVNAPHPELFRRFLESIGVSELELSSHAPNIATSVWVETFHAACREDQAQGIGALGIATEGIVRGMYGSLLSAIRLGWSHLAPRDIAFFVLHAAVDDEHAQVLRSIAIDLASTSDSRRRMAIGVMKGLQSRACFFDQMQALVRAHDSTSRRLDAEAA